MRTICFDFESHLIQPGQLCPRLVCMSYVERDGSPAGTCDVYTAPDCEESGGNGLQRGLCLRERAVSQVTEWLRDDDVCLVGHNLWFDLGVAVAEDASLLPLVFAKLDKGLIRDTQLRQQLIDVAQGEMKFHEDDDGEEILKTKYDLASTAYRLLKKWLKKKETWRLRYALLDGVPLNEWPEEAKRYAIDDSVTALEIYEEQDRVAGVGDTCTEIPNSLPQHQAAWALHLMSCWGVRTDGAAVAKLKAELERDYSAAMEALRPSGLLRFTPARQYKSGPRKGQVKEAEVSKIMREIKKRVLVAYGAAGLEPILDKKEMTDNDCGVLADAGIPLSDSGKNVSTSKKTLTESGDPQLKQLAEAGGIGKLLNTYVPVLESGTKVPIQPRYNVLVETGRTSCSSPNCFDGQTEILTKTGWQRFDQYDGIEVAQYWPQAGSIEFVAPSVTFQRDNKEPLIRITNEHISLAVTPDHRCLLQQRKTDRWQIWSAASYPEDWKQYNAGLYMGGPGVDLTDAELILVLATQADGSYHDDGVGLDFSFYRARKIERFRKALIAAGASYSEGERPSYQTAKGPSPIGARFRIHSSELSRKIKDFLGSDKKLGPWVLDLTRAQLDRFCEEVFLWDGCVTRMNHYASKHVSNADWVQIALTLSNRRAKVRIYTPDNPNAALSHQVDVSRNNYSMTTNVARGRMDAPYVYCVTVPSSYIVVRRDGAAMITGNCQNPPRAGGVRPCFVPRPGWVFAFADFDTAELRSLAQVCLDVLGESVMAEELRAGKDLHLALAADMANLSYEQSKRLYDSGDNKMVEDRQFCKIPNFGLPGGLGAETLIAFAEGYGKKLTLDQAHETIDAWHAHFKEMRKYFAWVSELNDSGEPITQLRSGRVRGGAGYCAIANGFFQGLTADGAKAALYEVSRECYVVPTSPLYGCRPWLFMHDEVSVTIPRKWIGARRAGEAADRLAQVMIREMSKFVPDIPTLCSPYMARRWFKGAKAVRVNGVLVPSKPVKGEGKTTWIADLDEVDAAEGIAA